MSPVCRYASHRVRRNKECHKQGRHPSNIVWLAELVPDRLGEFLKFSPVQHPNSKHSESLDPRWLGRRFRFFLADEGE
jgi:hypothetical protein